MDYNDRYLFAGTGMKEDEIGRVLSAQDDESRIKELRTCRLRLIGEVHEKQQELDKLDYLISCAIKQ